MKAERNIPRQLAYPLAIGTPVVIQGRLRECANLIEPGDRLLDVGCSSGWLGSLVIEKGFKEYVGMDRIIIGSDHVEPNMAFIEGSIFSLPFSDGTFDAVCLFDVIEHLPRGSEERALQEVRRVLRPQGRLYFSTPHASLLHTPLDPVWLAGHRHYRRRTVRRLLESAGMKVDRIFVAGGVIECLDLLRLLLYKHLLHRPVPRIDAVSRLIERSHRRDRRAGMTVFAVGTRA